MDRKLHDILQLYGERPPAEGPASDEIAELRYVKERLDERPRVSAPEDVIRNVLYFAAKEDHAPRKSQAPARPAHRRERTVFALAGSSAAMLIMALMFLIIGPEPEPVTEILSVAEVTKAPQPVAEVQKPVEEYLPAAVPIQEPEPSNRMPEIAPTRVRPAPPQIELASMTATTSNPQVVRAEISEAGLAWDDGQDLRHVHHMINVIQARGDEFEWEEPAVPLDLMPETRTRSSTPRVIPAGGPSQWW